ncbi:MAG: amidohydrolase [Ruminococcaceae bacterium]|nr:amidohydrolase [Oscillospiraceae bacterium]
MLIKFRLVFFMQKIFDAVDKHRQLILDAERYIWKNAETGYKEFKTSKYLEDSFEKLGYDITRAENITGFYTDIDTGIDGPTVLIMGELDSVICPSHPEANNETGAVHSCGHNAQTATLLGIAAALKEDGVTDNLCGKIRLCAVPAEEMLEIEFRNELKAKGIIKYLGGKTEFLYRGYFDGVDIAFMVHTADTYNCVKTNVGFMNKNITYKGVSAHAGGSPWEGKNALYAATCGINAVNAIRETFKENDAVRVHPIITNGGAIVNAIPETVTIESYVRGNSFDAIIDANQKVNSALVGGALSLGTNIEIKDAFGYAPLNNDDNMISLAKEAAEIAIPEENFKYTNICTSASTDMGDLSSIMPVVHPYAGGSVGTSHGNNYYIEDPEKACIKNAKWQLTMLNLLLRDDAKRAKQIISEFKPLFATKNEYLSYIDSLSSDAERIKYNDDGTANVIIK